jgi:hypothetical protein
MAKHTLTGKLICNAAFFPHRADDIESAKPAETNVAFMVMVKALEITRKMIRGEQIEAAIVDLETMQSLGAVIDAALALVGSQREGS